MHEGWGWIDPPEEDSRRVRRYPAPSLFASNEEGEAFPPPTDLITKEQWGLDPDTA